MLKDKVAIQLDPGEVRVIKDGVTYNAVTQVQRGKIWFYFREFSTSHQSIDCLMEIELDVEGEPVSTYGQRIDLRSASARRALTTDLNGAYGNKAMGYNWNLILNNVFDRVSKKIQEEQKSLSVVGSEYKEIPFLIHPFLQEGVPNLLFAQSEAGKTWFALRMAASLATGKDFFEYKVNKLTNVLFLDYEDDQNTFVNRLHLIAGGMGVPFDELAGRIRYYQPIGSLRQNVEVIRRDITEHNIGLVIIDAGGDAAGGSPSDEEKVLDLFNGLTEIGATKLILHHEPKYVVSEQAAFYGSMYWKARSRVAWRLEVENEEGGQKLIKASIQKRSNIAYVEPFYYRLNFNVLLDSFVPAVVFEGVKQSELSKGKNIEEAIVESLEKYGDLTTQQLAEAVGRERSVVQKTMAGPMKNLVEKKKVGKGFVWALK